MIRPRRPSESFEPEWDEVPDEFDRDDLHSPLTPSSPAEGTSGATTPGCFTAGLHTNELVEGNGLILWSGHSRQQIFPQASRAATRCTYLILGAARANSLTLADKLETNENAIREASNPAGHTSGDAQLFTREELN